MVQVRGHRLQSRLMWVQSSLISFRIKVGMLSSLCVSLLSATNGPDWDHGSCFRVTHTQLHTLSVAPSESLFLLPTSATPPMPKPVLNLFPFIEQSLPLTRTGGYSENLGESVGSQRPQKKSGGQRQEETDRPTGRSRKSGEDPEKDPETLESTIVDPAGVRECRAAHSVVNPVYEQN